MNGTSATLTFGSPERPADDGVAGLRDWPAALDRGREPDTEQAVAAAVVVELGRQLDPVDAGPEPDLLRAPDSSNGPSITDPLADRRRLDDDLAGEVVTDVNRPSGVRCHGPSPKSGCIGYSR